MTNVEKQLYKEIEELFIDEFKDEIEVFRYRFLKDILRPYLELEDGKNILLKTINILHLDRVSGYTILNASPGKFKTDLQDEKGYDALPFEDSPFTVDQFRRVFRDYDLINHYKFNKTYTDEKKFDKFYNFIDYNFDLINGINKYNKKMISLSELREIRDRIEDLSMEM